jgi:hypothetical protein
MGFVTTVMTQEQSILRGKKKNRDTVSMIRKPIQRSREIWEEGTRNKNILRRKEVE